MDTLIEILKTAATAALGGGGVWWFNFRAKMRRNENEINEADFNTVSKVVKSAIEDLRALAARIGELEQEKMKIMEEISTLKDSNAKLKQENARLEKALRAHITKNNPTMR